MAPSLSRDEFERRSRSSARDLVLFLSVIALLKFLFSNLVDLTPDEAYYWNWSNYLDLSYYDHPPMVAYLISLTTLFGYFDSAAMVRFGALVMSTGISVIVYRMATSIFGNPRAGLWAAVWLNASLLFSVGASIMTPDTPQAFFVMLYIYFLYEALFQTMKWGFYLAGVFLGLALLSKYTAILFIPSTLLFFLLSREHRSLLLTREIYLMFLLSLFLFLPVLVWNYQHNWVSFNFQLAHGLSSNSGHNPILGFLELLGTQILLVTPFLFLLLLVSACVCGRAGLIKKEPVFLFLFCMSVPVILFFFLVSLKTRIEGNWPSQGYMALVVVAGGVTAGYKRIFDSEKLKVRFAQLKQVSLVSASLIVLMVHLLVIDPPLFILKKTSIAKKIFGWSDLASRVINIIDSNELRSAFVLANSHQVSSEMNFYSSGRYKSYQVGEHYRYPYLRSHLDALAGSDAVYMAEVGEINQFDHVKKFFSSIRELKPIIIRINGQSVKVYRVYRCKNYTGGFI